MAHYGRIEYSRNFASDVVADGTRKRTKMADIREWMRSDAEGV